MLRLITIIIAYLISVALSAQENPKMQSKKLKVAVKVQHITNEKGTVKFAIYDSEDHFSQRKFTAVKEAPIVNGTAMVVFESLPPGFYAVTCYHDANENGRLDFAPNGIPEEDYGSTNNVFNYGPPRFEDAKFELTDKDLTFEIKFM